MTKQNIDQETVRGIGFMKTRKAMPNIYLFIKDMCKVARNIDVYPIGLIVDEGWSRDIDRQDVDHLYQRLEEEELSTVFFQDLGDLSDNEDDFCKFMRDMRSKYITVVDMKNRRVYFPDDDVEGCDFDE